MFTYRLAQGLLRPAGHLEDLLVGEDRHDVVFPGAAGLQCGERTADPVLDIRGVAWIQLRLAETAGGELDGHNVPQWCAHALDGLRITPSSGPPQSEALTQLSEAPAILQSQQPHR